MAWKGVHGEFFAESAAMHSWTIYQQWTAGHLCAVRMLKETRGKMRVVMHKHFHSCLIYGYFMCHEKDRSTPTQTMLFHSIYDSVVSLALPFVTLTPNCFALATISILFLDETALAILICVSLVSGIF